MKKGGTVFGSGDKEFGSKVVLSASANAGYSFVGWFKGNELISGSSVYEFDMPNKQLSYTVKWSANTYSISLNGDNNTEPLSANVIFDNSFSLDVPTKNGYNFNGWFTEAGGLGTQLTDNTGTSLNVWNIPNDTVIYANWNVISYSITYSLNGGNVLSNPESYTIEDLDINVTNPTKNGYNFVGWITSDNYTPNTTLTISAGSYGDKLYAAVWEQKDTFTAINTVDDFVAIGNNLNGFYYLQNDIDFEGNTLTTFGDENNPFTGVLEGNGYKISNLTITNGLFYCNKGTIQNLEIDSATATIATIAQINDGLISKCKVNTQTTGSGVTKLNNGTVEYCIVSGEITRYEDNASGIAGTNKGVIKNCIVHAEVYAYVLAFDRIHSNMYSAGIAAHCDGSIINCVVTGDIIARCSDGNLNSNYSYNAYAYRISQCECTKDNYYLETQTIESLYKWSSTTVNGHVDLSGVAKTEEQIKQATTIGYGKFVDINNMLLNNDNVWIFSDSDYPKIYWDI